jgi:hypothetical protein
MGSMPPAFFLISRITGIEPKMSITENSIKVTDPISLKSIQSIGYQKANRFFILKI